MSCITILCINKIKIGFIFSFLLLLSVSFAQQAEIEMSFVGYGKTYERIIISLSNTGEAMLTDVTLYIDGSAYKTIEGVSPPNSTFEDVLFLEEGEHLIEARTPEGAYDSISVTAKGGEVPTPKIEEPTKEEEIEGEARENLLEIIAENILGIFAFFLMIVLVIIWLQKRRSE